MRTLTKEHFVEVAVTVAQEMAAKEATTRIISTLTAEEKETIADWISCNSREDFLLAMKSGAIGRKLDIAVAFADAKTNQLLATIF